MSDKRRDFQYIFSILAFVISAVFYMWLVNNDSLRNNEFITIKSIQNDYLYIISERIQSNHMPGYFLALKLWAEIFGSGQFSLRLPSALSGVLGCVLISRLGARFLGPSYFYIILLAGCLNPAVMSVSTEARPYALLFLLSTLSIYNYILYAEGGGRYRLLIMAISLVAGIFIHLITLIFVFSICIHFLFSNKLSIKISNIYFVSAGMLTTLPFIIWWMKVQYYFDLEVNRGKFEFGRSIDTVSRLMFGELSGDYIIFFKELHIVLFVSTISILVYTYFTKYELPTYRKYKFYKYRSIFISVLVILTLGYGFSAYFSYHKIYGVVRYYIPVAVITPLIAGWTVFLLYQWRRYTLAFCYAGCVFVGLVFSTYGFIADPGLGLREAAKSLSARIDPEDLVISSDCRAANRGWVYYGAVASEPMCPSGISNENFLGWFETQIPRKGQFWIIYNQDPFKKYREDQCAESRKCLSRIIREYVEKREDIFTMGEIETYGEIKLGHYVFKVK